MCVCVCTCVCVCVRVCAGVHACTASTREDITKATVEPQQVTAECGLTISFLKDQTYGCRKRDYRI